MSRYRSAADVAALVEGDRVHRALYIDPELFALEQKHFFARTWNYLGHASQVPEAGDFITITHAGQALLMLRQGDGGVGVFHNRCAHKGAQLVTAERGNLGPRIRCPYHAWTYRLDGTPLTVPAREGYAGTRLAQSSSGRGLEPVAGVAVHRDFVFVRLSAQGESFADFAGALLASIDNLADRSPVGRLVIAGGVLRNVIACNWKMYLENINDAVHPVSAHASATRAAEALWRGQPEDAVKPMAVEQILPFGNGYAWYDGMGGRAYPNGHSVLGTQASIHSGYGALSDYEAAMRAAYGDARAADILTRSPQNCILYPSLSLKGSPQVMRVIRPLAVDRTLLEAWCFRVEGAPDLLFERSMTYNRLVFSPMSIVAHDDVHLFESIQRGLAAGANEWVSLHRDADPAETGDEVRDGGGLSELLMRNQYRAWTRYMTAGMAGAES